MLFELHAQMLNYDLKLKLKFNFSFIFVIMCILNEGKECFTFVKLLNSSKFQTLYFAIVNLFLSFLVSSHYVLT